MVDESRQSPTSGSCPDPETIAALVDGRLSGAEKAALEEHLASCEDCYGVFAETARAEEALAAPAAGGTVIVGRIGRNWLYLAAAAALVAAAIPLAVGYRARRRVRPDVAELVAAVGAERPFEPRLTGGFRFGPMAPRYRSAKPLSESDSWEVLAAAAKIRKNDEEHSTPATLDALGAANLILGKYDDAVSNLEEATLEEPKNARYLTDLSAAYLVRAKERGRADDYPKALEAAEKATEIDPAILEAWFNRALALDELPLKSEAAKAWKDYLKRDSTSGWAEEAKKRLAAIQAIPNHAEEWKKAKAKMLAAAEAGDEKTLHAMMPDWCQETREWIEEALLPDLVKGNSGLSGGVALELATAYGRASGDSGYRNLLQEWATHPTRRGFWSAGLEVLKLAWADYYASRIVSAEGGFARAEMDFHDQPTLKDVARLYHAATRLLGGHPRDAAREASDLVQSAPEGAGVVAYAEWIRGSALLSDGDPAAAVSAYTGAVSRLDSLRSFGDAASVLALRAQALHDLGDESSAWRDGRRAIALSNFVGDPDRAHTLFSSIAIDAIGRRWPAVSDHLERSAIERESSGASPVVRAESRVFLVRIDALRHRPAAARRDASAAVEWLRQVRDEGLSRRLRADLLASEAEVGLLSGKQGIDALSESERLFRDVEANYYRADIFLQRGRLFEQAGDQAKAMADFDRGIREFEEARLRDGDRRASHFDRGRALFEEAARLEWRREADPAAALAYVERMRARSLLESRGLAEPVPVSRIRATLEPEERLVYYLVLDRTLYEWVVSSAGVALRTIDVEQPGLEREIALLRQAWQAREAAAALATSTRLYATLIRPITPLLDGARVLLIVPDGFLGNVPFAALFDGPHHRYLVQDYDVEIVPSGSLLARSSRRAPFSPRSSVLLADGGTAGTQTEDRRLPETSAEIADLKRLYGRSVVLKDSAEAGSLAAAFLRLAPDFDIVHFAGHAVANPDRPGLARLIFEAPRGSESISARQIAALTLHRSPLVLLAACSTADGVVSSSEGIVDIAHAFLLAGASAVVASLWRVDDGATRDFMDDFHAALLHTRDPRDALASAQRHFLSKSTHQTWAAFEIIGTRVGVSKKGESS